MPDFIVVNLSDLTAFSEGEEVSLESLQEKRILNLSGRDTRLPLKVRPAAVRQEAPGRAGRLDKFGKRRW